MSEEEIIEVTIGADGKVEMEVKNVKGPACMQITESVEKVLGGQVNRTLKPEYGEGGVAAKPPIKKKKQQQQKAGG